MSRFPCPFLNVEVELPAERIGHIAAQHPELQSDLQERLAHALLDPDEVRVDVRFPRTYLFSRWFDDLLHGKILVVAVVSDGPVPLLGNRYRHWVVTAYPARRVTQGVIIWQRP